MTHDCRMQLQTCTDFGAHCACCTAILVSLMQHSVGIHRVLSAQTCSVPSDYALARRGASHDHGHTRITRGYHHETRHHVTF